MYCVYLMILPADTPQKHAAVHMDGPMTCTDKKPTLVVEKEGKGHRQSQITDFDCARIHCLLQDPYHGKNIQYETILNAGVPLLGNFLWEVDQVHCSSRCDGEPKIAGIERTPALYFTVAPIYVNVDSNKGGKASRLAVRGPENS